MPILVDANVIIDFKRGREESVDIFDLLFKNRTQIHTSVVCAMEVFRGDINKGEMHHTSKLLSFFNVIPVNTAVSHSAYELLKKFNKSHGLDIADSFIVATALVHNLKFLTQDTKHFKMIQGLELERPY